MNPKNVYLSTESNWNYTLVLQNCFAFFTQIQQHLLMHENVIWGKVILLTMCVFKQKKNMQPLERLQEFCQTLIFSWKKMWLLLLKFHNSYDIGCA